MPAGEVEEKEVWFDQNQEGKAFLSQIISFKESVPGARVIDTLEDPVLTTARILQMYSWRETWVTIL